MAIPGANDPVWGNLIAGKVNPSFEFLGIKIFLGHAQLEYKKNPTPDAMKKLSNDLRELFNKNSTLGSVQKDIAKLGVK